MGFHMSPSGGTICHRCVRSGLYRWLSLWIGYCRQPRPAQDRYVRLVLRSLWESRPEHDPMCQETGATGACVGDIGWGSSVLTLQDPSDVQGAVFYDCRPPLLPVSLDLSGIGPLPGLPPVVSASVGVPPKENGLTISGGGGVGSDGLDSGTDLEDELPTPDGSPSTDASKPVVGPTSQDIDLELARALLELGV